MNILWIQKKLEFDEDMIQLICPFCHDDKFFTHKDNEKMPKYCPMCGARIDLTDVSDAELVDTLQDVIEGRDKTIADLQDEAYNNKVLIRTLRTQLEEAQEEIDRADGYYCSMIDNLRDDIEDLKQQLALSDACCGDVIKKNKKLEEELFIKHNHYAQLRHEYNLLNELFEDVKKVVVTIRPNEWAAIAKKHNKEN